MYSILFGLSDLAKNYIKIKNMYIDNDNYHDKCYISIYFKLNTYSWVKLCFASGLLGPHKVLWF